MTVGSNSEHSRGPVLVAAAASLIVSCLLIRSHGTIDVDVYWLRWIDAIRIEGLRDAYRQSASDYPPLAFAILSGTSRVATVLAASPFFALKMTLWLFLIATALLFWWATGNAWLTVALHASLILNSVGLAYLDIYFLPTLLLAFVFIHRRRYALGLFLYTVSCLVKFQPAIVAPFVLLYYFRAGQLRWRVIAPSLMLIAVVFLVFGTEVAAAASRAGAHRYLSGQALNSMWLFAYAVNVLALKRSMAEAPLVVAAPGVLLALKIAAIAVYTFVLFRLPARTSAELLRAAAAGYAVYFTVAPGVHENHLIVLVGMLAVLASVEPAVREFLIVALLANLNLALFYGITGHGPAGVIVVLLELIVSATTTAMMIWLWKSAYRRSGSPDAITV